MNLSQTISLKILNKSFYEKFPLPTYATKESAGVDLRACTIEKMTTVTPGSRFLCPTGLAFDLNNENLAMFLIPKSGLGHKKGIILGNSVGLLDSDYSLECFVSVWNTSDQDFIIEQGMFIAQAYFAPVVRVNWNVVESFDRTVERIGGFGSSGTGL